ncbi:hypothetical protein LUZ61_004263 [Rhynchospora tenuis]|uniref:Glutathione S-transferase n=1 Tax=Rhynchospora tenuis TaxID=198213 RepID=A0AAD6ETE3_9POAL|nr:hypothetical protein LUZ61_004263 [Rhynchospora tenuis]
MMVGDCAKIMYEVKEVKLYGTWGSTYTAVVQNALKLKEVKYKYVQEDLENKSEELLRINPVHKQVPVLVVDGRPIAESLVILEYVDEMWKSPPIMPEDPYERAMVRFWADFIYKKVAPCSYTILFTVGEALEKAIEEFTRNLATLEEGIGKDFANAGKPFIHGAKPGLLDIIMGSSSGGIRLLADLTGKELIDKDKVPLVYSSVHSFESLPIAKETQVPYEQLLSRVLAKREKAFATEQP